MTLTPEPITAFYLMTHSLPFSHFALTYVTFVKMQSSALTLTSGGIMVVDSYC